MKKQIMLASFLAITTITFGQTGWTPSGSNLFNHPTYGYVGIGTNVPNDKLHINAKDNGGITVTQNNWGASILTLDNKTSGGKYWLLASTGLGNIEGAGNFYIQKWTPSETPATRIPFFIGHDGNIALHREGIGGLVGIGFSSAPQAFLHVKTPVNSTGTGLIIEQLSSSTPAYGNIVRIKNNNTKAFVVENNISTASEVFTVFGDGRTLIGDNSVTMPFGYKLYVQTGILTEKVKVALINTNDWADYVFEKDYKLKPLYEVKEFIKCNKHLPGVPSAQELLNNGGIDLGKMQAKLMEKVEELTLYIIEMDEKNKLLEEKIQELELNKNH